VFVYAELDAASAPALEKLSAQDVTRLCGGDECCMMMLKYDDWNSPEIRGIWNEVGHTKKPFLVLYSQSDGPLAFDAHSLQPWTSFKVNR
jgi:hypothetical protein